MGTSKYMSGNMFSVADSFGISVSKFWVFVFVILSYIKNMFSVADSFRVFVSKFWVFVFGILSCVISIDAERCCNSNDLMDTKCYKKGLGVQEFGPREKGCEVDWVKVNNETGEETENSDMASSTSKYKLLSGKSISGFIEEPKCMIFSVQEYYMGSNDSTNCDHKILATESEKVIDQAKAEDSVVKVSKKKEEISFLDTGKDFDPEKTENFLYLFLKKQEEEEISFLDTGKDFDPGKTENFLYLFLKKQEEEETSCLDSGKVFDKVLAKQENGIFKENEKGVFTEFRFLPKFDLSTEVQFLSKDCLVDSEFGTIGSINGTSINNDEDIELDAYEFLAERNFSEGSGAESLEAKSEEEEVESVTESTLDQATCDIRDVTFNSEDDCIELELDSHSSGVLDKHEEEDLFGEEAESEERQMENSAVSNEEIPSSEVLIEDEDNHEEEDLVYEATHPGHTLENFEESSLDDKESISDDDDDEFALEHDDLIEQLKTELKNARTGGLPTIFEESESTPKTLEELKPLKTEMKFEHKDHMKEIHKFYRSYLNKMRKLDILNSQTMYANGLCHLKGPGPSNKTRTSSVPAIKNLFAQNVWLCRPRKNEVNPAFKFIGDLHKDFELVYVGQLCLSWEILHWQYRKALELQEFDSQELRQYNQVASEFQFFQVLLRRFLENEPFQGYSRIQNYVSNRSARCNFLQVPVIKDDSLKDKKCRKGGGEYTITSPKLTAIIEESIRVYWEFLNADKDDSEIIIIKGPELQDSIDSELLSDIRTDFRKKERRLKEILRSGSCMVKKLQRHHENRFNSSLFFAQIELKLISRVLSLSKLTTDQLIWCQEKLTGINFCNRKLVFEPSVLLFPS